MKGQCRRDLSAVFVPNLTETQICQTLEKKHYSKLIKWIVFT